jgi:hypothetical protein
LYKINSELLKKIYLKNENITWKCKKKNHNRLASPLFKFQSSIQYTIHSLLKWEFGLMIKYSHFHSMLFHHSDCFTFRYFAHWTYLYKKKTLFMYKFLQYNYKFKISIAHSTTKKKHSIFIRVYIIYNLVSFFFQLLNFRKNFNNTIFGSYLIFFDNRSH